MLPGLEALLPVLQRGTVLTAWLRTLQRAPIKDIAVACAVLGWDRVRFPTDEILDLAWDCAPSGPGRAEDAAELVLQWQCRGMEVAV